MFCSPDGRVNFYKVQNISFQFTLSAIKQLSFRFITRFHFVSRFHATVVPSWIYRVKPKLALDLGRRGGLMVSPLDSGSSGPDSSHRRDHCEILLVFYGNRDKLWWYGPFGHTVCDVLEHLKVERSLK